MTDPSAPPLSDNFLDSLAEDFLSSSSPLDFPFDTDITDLNLQQFEGVTGDAGLAGPAAQPVASEAVLTLPLPTSSVPPDGGLGFGFLPPIPPQTFELQRPSMGDASTSSGDPGPAANGAALNSSGSGRQHSADQDEDYQDDECDKVTNQIMKFKEKNRAAQRRYRERQKEKLLASEERVAQLQQQLDAMRLEQETLSQRNALLERLLAMQQQAAAARPSGRGRSAIEAQKESWWLSQDMREYMRENLHLNGELLFTVRKSGPLRMTQAQVAELSDEEFGGLWKEYINAFAEHLLALDSGADSTAGKRLARLSFEGGQLKGSILMSYPDRIHAYQKRHYGKNEHMGIGKGEPPSDDVWARTADTAGLTLVQRQAIIRLRELYLRNVGILAGRRQQLTSVLQAALPIQNNGVCGGGGTDSKYSSTLGTMDALRDTLRDEHSCLMQFVLTVWRRVLTPAQSAHMSVTFFPANMDVLRLAEVLARAAGELPSAAIMAQGAADSTAQLLPVDVVLPPDMRFWRAPEVDLKALYPDHPSTPPAEQEKAPARSVGSPSNPGDGDTAAGQAGSGSLDAGTSVAA